MTVNADPVGRLALLLQDAGIAAHYEHTGGGIMCAAVYPNDAYRVLFGLSDPTWGVSIDNESERGINVCTDLAPDTDDATLLAWAFTILRPAVGEFGGIAISDPWLDETGRAPVLPWDHYGIPLPAGADRF